MCAKTVSSTLLFTDFPALCVKKCLPAEMFFIADSLALQTVVSLASARHLYCSSLFVFIMTAELLRFGMIGYQTQALPTCKIWYRCTAWITVWSTCNSNNHLHLTTFAEGDGGPVGVP